MGWPKRGWPPLPSHAVARCRTRHQRWVTRAAYECICQTHPSTQTRTSSRRHQSRLVLLPDPAFCPAASDRVGVPTPHMPAPHTLNLLQQSPSSATGQPDEEEEEEAGDDGDEASKATLDAAWAELARGGVDTTALWAEIRDVIVSQTVASMAPTVAMAYLPLLLLSPNHSTHHTRRISRFICLYGICMLVYCARNCMHG